MNRKGNVPSDPSDGTVLRIAPGAHLLYQILQNVQKFRKVGHKRNMQKLLQKQRRNLSRGNKENVRKQLKLTLLLCPILGI